MMVDLDLLSVYCTNYIYIWTHNKLRTYDTLMFAVTSRKCYGKKVGPERVYRNYVQTIRVRVTARSEPRVK